MPSNSNRPRPQRHSLNSLPPRPAGGLLAPSSSTGQQRPHRASYTQQQRPGGGRRPSRHNPLYDDDDDHHDQDHHQDQHEMLQDVLQQSLSRAPSDQQRYEGESNTTFDDDAIKHRERQARQNPSYLLDDTAPAMTSPPKATASFLNNRCAFQGSVEKQ